MLLFKGKTEAQTIFPNPFTVAHRANESLSFVRLLTKKQTEVIRLQTD
jgi:hypothetical protein